MNPEYRSKLLAFQSHIKQLIAEAESLTVDPNGVDETLLRVSKQLADLRSVLAEVERKVRAEILSDARALSAAEFGLGEQVKASPAACFIGHSK